MKIYLMHEIYYDLDIDWYNVYPYKNKDTALEHISNEVNEPLEDIKEYFKEHNEYKSGKYVYKIEESELQW